MWSNQIVLKSYTEHTKIRIYEINSRRVTESVGIAEKILLIFYEPHKSGHSARLKTWQPKSTYVAVN